MTATDWFALDMMGEIDVLLKLTAEPTKEEI